MVRSILSKKFHSDLQHNTFQGNIKMRLLWASTKRIYQLSYNSCTFRINEENKSYTYTVVFLQSCTAKNRFWLNRSRETCQNEWSVLTFDDKGSSYIPKTSDMPMTKKKLFLIILNNIVYYTFFLWVLWSSTKRNYQLSYNACTFWINEENKSYSYTVVFSYVQQKIDFGLIDHKRLVKMSGRFEPLMTTVT